MTVSGQTPDAASKSEASSSMQTFTAHQLSHFHGCRSDGSIYVAIQGEVFDVSSSRQLYGEGAPYASLAGREISRALARIDLDDVGTAKTTDLDDEQRLTLKEWIEKFRTKYKTMGRLKGVGSASTKSPVGTSMAERSHGPDWRWLTPVVAIVTGAMAFTLIVLGKRNAS